jgi:hypothetical protein
MLDNHLKPWTAAEVSELRRLAASDVPVYKIAQALGRTPKAVTTRLRPGKDYSRPISLKPT